ncbi:hypothetical protein F2Q69_00018455 [Brassica cretica]|uniref:Uncharacterized protein n=1 Tax=Brassica cretica TaxID=69181 RepID=A0A8S9Q3A5_BRACR|nr:hypothetical protein F2Q69_00018455 [Brassica cretica]
MQVAGKKGNHTSIISQTTGNLRFFCKKTYTDFSFSVIVRIIKCKTVGMIASNDCLVYSDSNFIQFDEVKKFEYDISYKFFRVSVSKDERSSHERREASYFSSSIYYGGQQHYSPPRAHDASSTSPSHHHPKETDDRTDTTASASRGNWWKGIYRFHTF